jgi:hypothetical protein
MLPLPDRCARTRTEEGVILPLGSITPGGGGRLTKREEGRGKREEGRGKSGERRVKSEERRAESEE